MDFLTFIIVVWLIVIYIIAVSNISTLEQFGINSPILNAVAIITFIVALLFIWDIF